MAATVSLSFRISDEKARRLEDLATATDRPKSWLLEQALDAYLETQAWQVAHIKKGIEQLDQGHAIAHEDIVAWLESWGKEDEKDPPQ